jgi:hypothetical protein
MRDPTLGLRFGKLMLAAATVEIVVALVCFCAKVRTKQRLRLVAWIATVFLVYRIGLWYVGWQHPCPCLGALAQGLHLSDVAADRLMQAVLAFLLLGSYSLLLRTWWNEPGSLCRAVSGQPRPT